MSEQVILHVGDRGRAFNKKRAKERQEQKRRIACLHANMGN